MTSSSDSPGLYTSTVKSGPSSANVALPPHPHLLTSYPPSAHFVSSTSAPSPPSLAPGSSSMPPAYSLPRLPQGSLMECWQSDYVGVNISLSNSSSFLFLNVYAPPICSSPTDGRTDTFSPSILLSFRNLFILGDFNCHHPLWAQEVLPTAVGRKYSTGSSLLTSSSSMTLTYLPFYIAPLAVTPPQTFPLLPPLLPFLAPGKCFRTWVLINYQFFFPSLSPQSFAPTSVPLPSIFRKLAGMTLPLTLTFTVLLQRSTRLFLFPLLLLSLPLWH